jgi:probable rRNA maturation factor
VSVVDDDGRRVRAAALADWLARVAPARARGAVTIAIVSDHRVRALNRQYRRADRATDVLSFPAVAHSRPRTRSPKATGRLTRPASASTHAHTPGQSGFLGDIVIARGVAARQARAAGHTERVEWRVLALHGLLHLLGHDHERDAGEMRRLERRLRRKGGLAAGLTERQGAE